MSDLNNITATHVLDTISSGICIINQDFEVLLWNSLMEEWSGIDREDMIGSLLSSGDHLVDKQEFENVVNSVLSNGLQRIDKRSLLNLNNNLLNSCSTSYQRLELDRDKFGVLIKIEDISDLELSARDNIMSDELKKEKRKSSELENELESSEKRFQKICSIIEIMIWEFDPDWKFLSLSPNTKFILGYEPGELMNKKLASLMADVDAEHFQEFIAETDADEGMASNIELWLKSASNEIGCYLCRMIPHFDVDQNITKYIGVVRDVTRDKENEEEIEEKIEELREENDATKNTAFEMIQMTFKLEESEEKLRKLNAAKDKFFSIIAHDLKSPFQGLLGYSALLKDDIDMLSKDEIKDMSGLFYESAESLFKLLQNLLEWSRIQRGNIKYSPEIISINELVQNVVNIVHSNALEKNIEIVNTVDSEMVAFADSNMVNTIVRNLVSNAMKFTNSRGKVEIAAQKVRGGFIEINVKDNGIGIQEKDINKLFRIDTHHTTKGTANEQGTGLGLILCRDLVEKNDGEISVQSEVGKGTTFTFTLPEKNKSEQSIDV